jgi:nitrite reductase/ring-hydroxylating ferredoxin subunit
MELEALSEGKPTATDVNGVGVMFYRHDGTIDAIADRCSHRGCSLHQGTVNDDESVTCPCHGRTFRLSDGAILRGPASAPQPSFETRVRDGKVEVRTRA